MIQIEVHSELTPGAHASEHKSERDSQDMLRLDRLLLFVVAISMFSSLFGSLSPKMAGKATTEGISGKSPRSARAC
jgi:hypothetical protein